MAMINITGLVLAVPAIIKFQFMKPPMKAENQTKIPNIKAIPTAISPKTTNLENHV